MIKWEDPKTHLPVLFGTTRLGGTVNYGALFRLTGLDLPLVRQPTLRTVWARTAATKTQTKSFQVAGQTELLQVNVISDIDADQITEDGYLNDNLQGRRSIALDAFNCRNPHIIQFISRDKYDVLRKAWVAGTYYLPDRYDKNVSYPFSFGDQEGDRRWRVDALQGPPNPYYDENFGAYHAVRSNVVSILDAPSFGLGPARPGVAPNYVEGAPERWRAVFRDFVICNCKPLVEVRWTREQGVRFHSNTQTWEHEFPVYKDVSIEAAPATALDWINLQLQGDAAGKQYPLLP